jgi:hypothetical protein
MERGAGFQGGSFFSLDTWKRTPLFAFYWKGKEMHKIMAIPPSLLRGGMQ